MKYVCLETNIFVGCALLTEQQHEPRHLQTIKNIVENQDIKFLLPEIIRREFEARLEGKKKEITKQLEEIQEAIGKKNLISHHDENQLQNYIKELKDNREKSIERAKVYIEELFSSSNCIEIPLTPEILVNSYLRQVNNLRPFVRVNYSKNRSLPIDTDCVIIESLREYFTDSGSSEDVLYFCNNDSDFYKDESLHPDISEAFSVQLNIYKYLPDLLGELGAQLNEEEKDELIKIQRRINTPVEQIMQMQEAMRRAIPWELIAQIQQMQKTIRNAMPWEQIDQIQQMQKDINLTLPKELYQQMQAIQEIFKHTFPQDRFQQALEDMNRLRNINRGEESEPNNNED